MRIGELSKATGISVESIRFYEKEGLLPEATRSLNNYRSYTTSHLNRLNFIRHCRSLDIGLSDIRLLIDVDARNGNDAEKVHALINAHIHKVDQKIEDLRKLRQHLGLLALCCHGHHANGAPCGLIEGLNSQICCHRCEEIKKVKIKKPSEV